MAKLMYQSPKGVKDVLPEDQPYWQHVEHVIHRLVELFGYERIDLPIFEETGLYTRGVGEGTDIVDKEMYTFEDKGGTSMTLRPEFTAGVMRSFLQNGMASRPKPVKIWSRGPVFRYERPQAGRFRQHTQFNVEALGEADAALDFEIMSVAWHLYRELGFKNLSFQINSIGCPKCRPGFLSQLKSYYEGHRSAICDECNKRLDKNPLRVLDCKKEQCQPIIENAPHVIDLLCDECDAHFKELRGYLDGMNRPYTVNHRLVRGLDYYTKTVFEVWAQGIGAQNAVCGGGRYDGLCEIIGGQPMPAVGFASGIERIVMTLKQEGVKVPGLAAPTVYLAWMGEAAKAKAVNVLYALRDADVEAVMGFGERSVKARFKEANKRGAAYVVVIGDEEIKGGQAQVKEMDSGDQQEVPFDGLISFFQDRK